MPPQTFVAKLNAAGQRWVPILDPPIHVQPGYAAYDTGIADDVFLKDITGRPFLGQVGSQGPVPSSSLSGMLHLLGASQREAEGMTASTVSIIMSVIHCTASSFLYISIPADMQILSLHERRWSVERACAAQMWPGVTYWPDFVNPKADSWWRSQINVSSACSPFAFTQCFKRFLMQPLAGRRAAPGFSPRAPLTCGALYLAQGVHQLMPLDGVWLDMNEVSNYCSGDVCTDPGAHLFVSLLLTQTLVRQAFLDRSVSLAALCHVRKEAVIFFLMFYFGRAEHATRCTGGSCWEHKSDLSR